ncbi:hypothetical protein M8J75_007115 [Diaphorina citri]|nr:hypothetical protein M8J75_007115 [Diaphorina citri]
MEPRILYLTPKSPPRTSSEWINYVYSCHPGPFPNNQHGGESNLSNSHRNITDNPRGVDKTHHFRDNQLGNANNLSSSLRNTSDNPRKNDKTHSFDETSIDLPNNQLGGESYSSNSWRNPPDFDKTTYQLYSFSNPSNSSRNACSNPTYPTDLDYMSNFHNIHLNNVSNPSNYQNKQIYSFDEASTSTKTLHNSTDQPHLDNRSPYRNDQPHSLSNPSQYCINPDNNLFYNNPSYSDSTSSYQKYQYNQSNPPNVYRNPSNNRSDSHTNPYQSNHYNHQEYNPYATYTDACGPSPYYHTNPYQDRNPTKYTNPYQNDHDINQTPSSINPQTKNFKDNFVTPKIYSSNYDTNPYDNAYLNSSPNFYKKRISNKIPSQKLSNKSKNDPYNKLSQSISSNNLSNKSSRNKTSSSNNKPSYNNLYSNIKLSYKPSYLTNLSGISKDGQKRPTHIKNDNTSITNLNNETDSLVSSSTAQSQLTQADLKSTNGIASDIGSYEDSADHSSIMSSAALPLHHSARLPPDGHEFPQSYQEDTRPDDPLSYPIKPNQANNGASGLPPLPNTGPPIMRKLSRASTDSFPRELSSGREASPRKDTPPRRDSNCDTKTDFHRYKGADSPNYKYQNKDEKSEKSVRDKIAMFSNASPPSKPVASYGGSPGQAHRFAESVKRPLTREPSPYGAPVTPTSPVKEPLKSTDSSPISGKKELFKNNEIVSHTYLTNLEVDTSFNQQHYPETGVCQSESSAYSSLSTSEILSDKTGDYNVSGFNGAYSKPGYDTMDYVNLECVPSPDVQGREDMKEVKEYSKNDNAFSKNDNAFSKNDNGFSKNDNTFSKTVETNAKPITESPETNRQSSPEMYRQKYAQDLYTGRQNDTTYNNAKSTTPKAYNKFSDASDNSLGKSSTRTLSNDTNSLGKSNRTPEYKINDFSSLPRKLKVLKSLDQESRETSPESGTGGYTSKLTRTISFNSPPLLNTRSQSMIDINKNGADSISKLMEKRKKNISKLKGLIIPEKPEIPVTAAVYLPEIKIKTPSAFLGSTELLDSASQNGRLKPVPLERTVSNPLDRAQGSYERKRNNSVDNTIDQVDIARNVEAPISTSTWDLNDIPKYSPAFKRKSLTVYDKNKQTHANPKKVSPPKPPRKSYEKINNEQIDALISFDRIKENCSTRKSPPKFSSGETEQETLLENGTKLGHEDQPLVYVDATDKHSKNSGSEWTSKDNPTDKSDRGNERFSTNERLSVKKLNVLTAYDTESHESDNDSAISSNVSPPLSPLKREDDVRSQRKISTNSSSSTLTSGDDTVHYQGAVGDAPAKRILKPQSVEAVNRKNVLSSAKFRSGDKTNEPVAKDNVIHEDLARCVDNKLKETKGGFPTRKLDDDEYSSSTLNENDEEDFEFNDECTDKIYSRRISNIKVAYLDVQVDSAESSDDILSSSDMISEGANSDDEMSVTSSECKNHGSAASASDDWGNTPDEICSKIEEYIDDLEMYSQEIEEKRSKLISERTRKVRRTQESVKIDKFVRTNEFLRNAKLSEASEKLAERHTEVEKPLIINKVKTLKEKEIVKTTSRSRLDRLKNHADETETTETEASIDEVLPKPTPLEKPLISKKPNLKSGNLREPTKVADVKHDYARSISNTDIVKSVTTRVPISRKSTSVSDIRKVVDAKSTGLPDHPKPNGVDYKSGAVLPNQIPRLPSTHHMRVSSLDSTTSDDSFTMQREQFGSITSIASSTSLISQQELQQLIDESNQSLDEGGCPSLLIPGTSEVSVVVLHRDLPGNSVGITLAGGSDYESKEITVHKVICGTPADRDGRLQKGDRILSINGKSMKGLTHKESLAILKTPRSEVVLVVSRWKPSIEDTSNTSTSTSTSSTLQSPALGRSASSVSSASSAASSPHVVRTRRSTSAAAGGAILENPAVPSGDITPVQRGPPVEITLIKDGAGLGFSLEGGKDSPFGDQPLTVKKIFTGGCAEKNGQLKAGDEILTINNVPVTEMSRIEAWSLLKKLNDGTVHLTLRHKI